MDKVFWVAFLLVGNLLFANGEPKWLYTPSLDGVVGAVGYSAPNEDKKLQKKVALIDARGKLSESLKIKIENETLKSSSSDGASNFERKSTQTSDNLVRGAKVKEEFVDEDGGTVVLETINNNSDKLLFTWFYPNQKQDAQTELLRTYDYKK